MRDFFMVYRAMSRLLSKNEAGVNCLQINLIFIQSQNIHLVAKKTISDA